MKIQSPLLAAHLARRVRRARRCYLKCLARCQKKFSEKAVHNLRVETRRILALLDLLVTFGDGKGSEKLAKTLTKRLWQIGHLRDTQVQLELLEPLWPDFPEAHSFKTILLRREKKLTSRLSEKVESMKGAHLNQRLKEIERTLGKCAAATDRSTPVAAEVEPALNRAFQEVLKLRRAVDRENVASIHRMRIAFKRFRYLCELLQPLLPGVTDPQLERMKKCQAQAGGIQDLQVLLVRIAQTIRDRKLNPAAVRNLRGELLRRKEAAINSFMMRIDELQRFETAFKPGRN